MQIFKEIEELGAEVGQFFLTKIIF